MKRILLPILLLCCLLLASCKNDATIGIIGGADGPTAILVSDGKDNNVRMTFGEQYEKTTIRMFNVDGELYYDSGLVSDMTPRCGTLDDNLKKGVGENEIPHKSGEANFEIDGYQNATSITKEVNIDGEWVIFRKYKYLPEDIDELKYCYYIKGHLNNAAIDSEIVVLTDSKDITFNDVYEPLLSSQAPVGSGYLISHNMISGDKWGLNLYAEDVTPTGLTLKIEQFGGNPSGELQTGADYFLETTVNDEWQEVETINGQPLSWNALAYMIKKNDITEMNLDWQYAYGELKPGFYRLTKEFMDFRGAGDYEKETYLVHFTIE